MSNKYGIIVITALMVIMSVSRAGAKEVVSIEKVTEAGEVAMQVADEAADLRERMEETAPMDFLKKINELAETLEPYVVMIAETEAPNDAKQYAAHVAMGLKSVELSMWYYLVGVLEQDSDEINIADNLLEAGIAQLEYAADFLE